MVPGRGGETGRRQAERTAEYLVVEGVDHVVSSTMTRALQTAAPLAASLGGEIETRDDLRESDHRSNVYLPVEEWTTTIPPSSGTWTVTCETSCSPTCGICSSDDWPV